MTKNQPVPGLRERKKAKTMASIQMHALRLFREHGYNATTVEQIAEAAEISPSTFFRYFATKEDVVIMDNYDPVLIAEFENQPPELSPLQAVRNAMLAGLASMSADELDTVFERNQLIMTVPELRAATINNLTQTMQMITELVAGRVGKPANDLDIRLFAGSIMGMTVSVMLHCAENPDASFSDTLIKGFNRLEAGLTFN